MGTGKIGRQLYGVRLSHAALVRGARLICEVQGTPEPGAAYVRVRIVHSTLSDRRYAPGRERMILRAALVPVRPAEQGHAA